ncbi:MAG: hypothetical protein QOI99_1475 [Actinomycetota bacterium]|nr:hypothetical protein [Actinomycetota bacterium]
MPRASWTSRKVLAPWEGRGPVTDDFDELEAHGATRPLGGQVAVAHPDGDVGVDRDTGIGLVVDVPSDLLPDRGWRLEGLGGKAGSGR